MDMHHFNCARRPKAKAKPRTLSFEDAALLEAGAEAGGMFTLDSDFEMLGVDTTRAAEVAPGVMCFARADGIELSRSHRSV